MLPIRIDVPRLAILDLDFLVHALLRRLLLLEPLFTTETFDDDDEDKYSLPRRGSPFKGPHLFGVGCC